MASPAASSDLSEVPMFDDDHENLIGNLYGESTRRQFEKEATEKKFKMDFRPDLCSRKMMASIVALEILAFGSLGLALHWLFVDPGGSNTADNRTKLSKEKDFQVRTHFVMYFLVYATLLPQLLVLNIKFGRFNLIFVNFGLKSIALVIFFIGWRFGHTIYIVYSNDHSHDHLVAATVTSAAFSMYIGVTSIQVIGYFFKQIFFFPVLGYILRLVVSQWFENTIELGNYACGFTSIITGLNSYIRLILISEHKRSHKPYETDPWVNRNDLSHIRGLYIASILLQLGTFLLIGYRHHLLDHTRCISKSDFKNHFLKHFKPPEEPKCLEKNEIPRGTCPVRKL